jgi:hypothetical protein
MQLKIQIKSGGEVKWRGIPQTQYYGGPPPETGEWKLDIKQLEHYFCQALQARDYGGTPEAFILGFEIAELEGWGAIFTKRRGYTGYSPKFRALVSVGQLNWPDVKDLSEAEQFKHFSAILLQAIERVGTMQRKPKHFDVAAFAADVILLLHAYPLGSGRAK